MLDLIKMETYKLRTTKLFIILAAVVFAVNGIFSAVVPIVTKMFTPDHTAPATNLSEAVSSPFMFSLLLIPVFISAVSFLYSDFTGGYIKNIAGQVGDRGKLVIAKFIVLGLHNLIFFVLGALSGLLGTAIGGQIVMDGAILGGVMTLLLKWLLSMAVCSILLFFAVGIRNKVLASIVAVVFSVSALSLVYLAVNTAAMNVLKIEGFDLGAYMPDALMNSVNAVNGTLVVNGLVVAAVFIGLFVTLTYMVFKKRDVK